MRTNIFMLQIPMEKVITMENMFLQLENKDTVGVVPKILLQKYLSRASDLNDFYNVMDLPYRYKVIMLVPKTGYRNKLTKQR